MVPFLPRLFNYQGITECLHCNKTPECIQVPGDLLTCTQHWQSAARVRCAWWWWHHHFWQLSPRSVEWGNVPKIKTDSRINNDRFLEPSLYALNWSSISSLRDCQKIIIMLQHTISEGHQQGTQGPAGRFGHTWALADCIFHWRWAGVTAPEQLPSSQMCQHSALGVQLEWTHRDVAVSSWGRVQPEEGSVSCWSPLKNLHGHTKKTPAGPQNLAQHIHGHFLDFLEQFAGGLACLAQGGFDYLFFKFCKGKRKEGKHRLWLTPCDRAPSAPDLSSHRPKSGVQCTDLSHTDPGLTAGHCNLQPFKHLNLAFFLCSAEHQRGRQPWNL